jgi:hypothetical protein
MATSSNPTAISPQHILAKRASDLSRRIYVSFPWGFRVANVLVVLAGDSLLDACGRVTTAQFILAVVRNLPDVAGKPASDWIQEVYKKGPNVLPPGTGREFSNRFYKILLVRFSDPEVVQEAMSAVMLQIARGKFHIANGVSVHEAESYVITAGLNAGRDILRARGRRREESLVRDHEGENVELDVEDPAAFERLDHALPAAEMRKILNELGEVHPRAPEWLKARLDGQSGQEISEAWKTTPSYVSKWQRTYLPRIKTVVEHHLRQARRVQSASYDYRAVASP